MNADLVVAWILMSAGLILIGILLAIRMICTRHGHKWVTVGGERFCRRCGYDPEKQA